MPQTCCEETTVVRALIGVPNVTALRALPGVPLDVVELLGYFAPGDGGGGTFQWLAAASPDDGVTRFNAGAANVAGWQRIEDTPLSLPMGGALGDGVTNDSAAIQRVFDAATAGKGGGAVYVPGKTFLSTDPLTVQSSLARPVTIFGDGKASELNIINPGAATVGISLGAATLDYFTLKNVAITGQFTQALSFLGTITNVRIEGCDLSGATEAIGGSYNALIAFSDSNDVWIVDNYLHVVGSGAAQQGYAIVRASGVAGDRIHVRNNRIANHMAPFAIALFDCSHSDVMGNYVDQNNIGVAAGGTGYGILIYRSIAVPILQRNQVSNNYVTNTAGIGIYLQNSQDSVISDNIVFDACKTQTEASLPLGGISANGDRVAVTGNVVQVSAQAGINSTGNQGTITGNIVKDAATHGIFLQGSINSAVVSSNDISGGVNGIVLGAGAIGEGQVISSNSCASGTGTGTGIGVLAPGVNFVTIQGNYCREYLDNIYIDAGAQNTICNNVCRAAFQDNFDIRCANSLVSGNVAQGAVGRGIFCSGNQVTITGNEITANGGLPIDYTGSVNSFGEKNRFSAAGAMQGVGVLGPGNTLLVATAEVQAGDVIRLTPLAPAGVQGDLSLGAIVAGVSFVVNSNSGGADTSAFYWEIVH